MIKAGGLTFDIKLTPLTNLRIRQLAEKFGTSADKLTRPEYINFMIATFCGDPEAYLEMDIDKFEDLNKQVAESEDFKRVIAQLQRMSKNGKKPESKTRE